MKKLSIALLAGLLLAGCSTTTCPTDEELVAQGWVKNPAENGYVLVEDANILPELPVSVDTTKTYKDKDGNEVACTATNFTTSCAGINSENLHQYLGRDDVVYIDLRDYSDYAKKHLKNFEVLPYFAAIFNAEAHTDATKPQLYGGSTAEPVAVYEESDALLNAMIPTDKTVFLMCQSGGRVAQMMTLLNAKGYDMTKIYNVGGMGQYTADEYAEWTTDNAELTITATYAFEGLTRK